MDAYCEPAVLKYTAVLCCLSILNVITWGYLVYLFWAEQLRKVRRGFFPVIAVMVVGFFTLNLGVLIIRGVYLLRGLGLIEPMSEGNITIVSHVLQIIMGVCMLIVSLILIEMIHRRMG